MSKDFAECVVSQLSKKQVFDILYEAAVSKKESEGIPKKILKIRFGIK